MQGWVQLHRQLLESAVFKSEKALKVWLWCLLRANHKRTKILWNGAERELLPGQFITGRLAGAEECGMKPSTFWDQLSLLRRLGNLDIKSDSRNSLVSIVKWTQYQPPEKKSDSSSDSQPTASRQPADTDNNVRMEECKNPPLHPPPPAAEDEDFLLEVKKRLTRSLSEQEVADLRELSTKPGFLNAVSKLNGSVRAPLPFLRAVMAKDTPRHSPSSGRGDGEGWRSLQFVCVDCGQIHRTDEVCPLLRA